MFRKITLAAALAATIFSGSLMAGQATVSFWQYGKTDLYLTNKGSTGTTCQLTFYKWSDGSQVGNTIQTGPLAANQTYVLLGNSLPGQTWGSYVISCTGAAVAHSYYRDSSETWQITINGGNEF